MTEFGFRLICLSSIENNAFVFGLRTKKLEMPLGLDILYDNRCRMLSAAIPAAVIPAFKNVSIPWVMFAPKSATKFSLILSTVSCKQPYVAYFFYFQNININFINYFFGNVTTNM